MVIVWFIGIIASFILLLTQLKKEEEGKIKSGDIVTDLVVSLFSWITFVIVLVVMVDKKDGNRIRN